MNCEIRRLQEQDWALWKEIRLESLKLHPEAFGVAYEEELLFKDEEFKQHLIKSDVFGAFINHNLVGIARFFIVELQKLQHRGNLVSVYVRKESRGHGVADQLVKAIINHARTRVLQLHCTVNTENESALKLYQKHRFQIYGTIPRSLKVGETFYDEHLMILRFD